MMFYQSYPCHLQNEGSKKKSKEDNDEESAAANAKRDEPDRAALMMFRPLVSDPIYINRKCPLPRSKKIGSVEVSATFRSSSEYTDGIQDRLYTLRVVKCHNKRTL